MSISEVECFRRQTDEIEALQSIFPEEFLLDTAQKKPAWGAIASPGFSILLRCPDISNSSKASFSSPTARLHVVLGSKYPRIAPHLDLADAQNLSQLELNELKAILLKGVEKFTGSEMIYDIVTLMQTALKDFVRPLSRSLIEERDLRIKADLDKLSAERQQKQLDAHHAQNLYDMQMREQIEATLRARTTHQAPASTQPIKPNEVLHAPTREITFNRPFVIGASLVRSLLLSLPVDVHDSSCTRPWLSFLSGGTIVVKEYTFDNSGQEVLRELENNISIVSQKLSNYAGVKDYSCTVLAETGLCKLYLAQEYMARGSLKALLNTIKTITVELAKRWLIDLATEVVYAHRQGISHWHISPSKIMLVDHNGRIMASLCDWQSSYIAHRRFESLGTRQFRENSMSPLQASQRPDDVVDLCAVFLQMILGCSAVSPGASIEQILRDNSHDIPLDITDFLTEVVHNSKYQRITASDLLSMEFLRTVNFERTPLQSQTGPQRLKESRYLNDFEELSKIGRGAYGTVVKARNRLDGRTYAIKKIKTETESRVLREVSGLARLNHPAIVRYFGSWVEMHNEVDIQSSESISDDTSDDSSDGSDSMTDDFMSTSGIVFAHSSVITASKPERVQLRSRKVPSVPRSLFIQMEYCSGNTLRALIDGKEIGELYWSCFSQIVEGVTYIHSQGLIHRDLKPANIFVSSDGQLKLGDFGLVMESVAQSSSNLGCQSITQGDNTGEVGTFLYQAPELLNVTLEYDAKVDLYALGIILGEMICPWTTGMERVVVLRQLRQPIIIHSLDPARFPREIEVLLALLNHEPSRRPTANQLCNMLPPVVHRSRLQDTLKLLRVDRIFRDDILSHFFSNETTLSEFVYDAGDIAISESLSMATAYVMDEIRQIFRAHGGLDRALWCHALFPFNTIYQEQDHIVKVLDESANLLQLPFDFKVPFARQLARTTGSMTSNRTFLIGPVYRAVRDRSRSLLEADFDIVDTRSSSMHSIGVEALRILCEIVTEIPKHSIPLRIVLGHTCLAKLVLQQARVPERDYSKVLSILVPLVHNVKKSTLGHWSKALASVVPQSVVLELIKFKPSPEALFEDELNRVLNLLDPSKRERAWQVKETLIAFFQTTKLYAINLPVSFSTFSYGYLLFDLTYSVETITSTSTALAVGGTYTKLVSSLTLPGTTEKSPEVSGFSLAIDKLVQMMNITQRKDPIPRQVDVVINARAHEARAIELATRLWASRISTELCFEEESQALCAQRNAKLLLTFKDRKSNIVNALQLVKVRHVETNDSEDVALDAVITYVLAELSETSRSARQPLVPKLERTMTSRKDPEVIIIISGDESKKQKASQRDLISNKALECVRTVTDQLGESSVPILAVEFEFEHMQLLRTLNPRMNDDSHMKRISDEMVNVLDRAHFSALRSAIHKLQELRKTNCFIYSSKCSEILLVPL